MSQKPIKVLYINHYGTFGGSQRSILELVSSFPENTVHPHFISPVGRDADFFEKFGLEHTVVPWGLSKFDHTRASYYKGFRWFIVLREIAYLFPTFLAFWKFRKQASEFHVIHINEITCIPALILAKKIFKKPIIVHARAVYNNDTSKKRTRVIKRILETYADRIVAIDETVAESLAMPNKVKVIHNGFAEESKLNTVAAGFGQQLGRICRRRLNLGFIGAIHYNKGIMDLLEAMRLCREMDMDVGLIIAGNGNSSKQTILHSALSKIGINQDKNAEMLDFIEKHQLSNCVHTLGFSTNTVDFFRYIDVICFPSYFNALGRPVFEAAFFSKPGIVAVRNPLPDTFIEGVTGLKVEEKNPRSICDAIATYYHNPHLISTMGFASYKLANKNFDIKANALEMLELYKTVAARPS